MTMKKTFILLFIAYVGWKLLNGPDQVTLGSGIYAPKTPEQINLSAQQEFVFGDFSMKTLATFVIEAKVLSKEDYFFDTEAELSPTDVALGWGKMSDESVLADIEISQSGRFYWWRVESFPIPKKEIESHSANMHLIPADESVAQAISQIRKGEIIEIIGTLVHATSVKNGWTWRSSLTRNDVGAGACELILVKSIRTVYP